MNWIAAQKKAKSLDRRLRNSSATKTDDHLLRFNRALCVEGAYTEGIANKKDFIILWVVNKCPNKVIKISSFITLETIIYKLFISWFDHFSSLSNA